LPHAQCGAGRRARAFVLFHQRAAAGTQLWHARRRHCLANLPYSSDKRPAAAAAGRASDSAVGDSTAGGGGGGGGRGVRKPACRRCGTAVVPSTVLCGACIKLQPAGARAGIGWKSCEGCGSVMPPRKIHCDVCGKASQPRSKSKWSESPSTAYKNVAVMQRAPKPTRYKAVVFDGCRDESVPRGAEVGVYRDEVEAARAADAAVR
jgi:hypothetical protein